MFALSAHDVRVKVLCFTTMSGLKSYVSRRCPGKVLCFTTMSGLKSYVSLAKNGLPGYGPIFLKTPPELSPIFWYGFKSTFYFTASWL